MADNVQVITFHLDNPSEVFKRLQEITGRRVFITGIIGKEVERQEFPYNKTFCFTVRYIEVSDGLVVCNNIKAIEITNRN